MIKKMIDSLLLLCFIGSVSLFLLYQVPNKKNNNIQLNQIYQEVLLHIDSLSDGDYSSFDYPFSVLSPTDQLLFSYGNPPDTKISSALSNSDTIFTLTKDNTVLGTLLISTNSYSSFYKLRTHATIFILLVLLFSMIVLLFFFNYIRTHIIHPCKQMQSFSKEIANGNLDFQLPITKDNLFGSFTESFDLMRDELSHAKEQEYLANQSKKELVASLSHDIKTPITSIQLTTELLLVTTKEEMTKKKLLTISQKTAQINNLVSDLFHAALEDLEALKVNVTDIYSSTLSSMLKECDSNDMISLSTIPDCILSVDPIRLRQVFSNIIYNSYKYAKTSIEITFQLNETHLEVHIKDFGPGVSEDDLPLLFNKFYRGKNSSKETGSGLGLYICKQLLSQMYSEIYCSNTGDGFETLLLLKLA